MDFLQRGTHQNTNAAGPQAEHHTVGRGRKRPSGPLGYITGLLLLSVTVLLVALLISLVTRAPKNEAAYVDTKTIQAVFLNNGQVYFGRIQSLNDQYVRLTRIFYLRVNQQVQPNGKTQNNDPELVPLGCELHRPQNEMLINREQVSFWENLKDDASLNSVPGAVKKYIADNPNGKACTTPTTTPTTNSTDKQQ